MKRLRIAYGSQDFTLSRPYGRTRRGLQGIGAGRMESAAGVPAGWVTRWDRTLALPLRITESEWPQVRAWLEYAMPGGAFSVYLDSRLASSLMCYLVSPSVDELTEGDLEEYPGDEVLQVRIRRVDGQPIDEAFYG